MHTTFTNNTIDIDKLPSISELDLQPLERQYRKNNLVLSATVIAGSVVLISIVRYLPFIPLPAALVNNMFYVVLMVLFLGGLHLFYRFLADPIKCYALREKDISYRSGLIFRKTVTQPIKRIQHVEVERDPVERYTGLATIQVFSAGGSGHTFAIPGLAHNQAMHIRQFILTHKENNTAAVQEEEGKQDSEQNV